MSNQPKTGCVAIIVEQWEGDLQRVSVELLGEGSKLAKKLGVDLVAVVPGHEVHELAQPLIEYGADKVYFLDHPELKVYRSLPYRNAVRQWVLSLDPVPQVVLMGGTTTGRDFAPRLASTLETGLTADCIELDIGPFEVTKSKDKTKIGYFDNCLHASRPSFGESLKATILGPWKDPQMATVRPGVFVPLEKDATRKGEIIHFKVELEEKDFRFQILETARTAGSDVNLDDAKVIISFGYGLGDSKGLELVRELAGCFNNSEIGCSRKAVDAGWLNYPHQIGQTGKTVHSEIYIALGISGAIQHRVGMQESKLIIAVNKDPDANIFGFSHYGIVGDMYEVVP